MTPATRTGLLPWVAPGGTMLLWASSFVVIRGAAEHFAPGAMSLLRMTAASLVLLVWALLGIAHITVATSAAHITVTGLGLSLLCALLYAGSVLTQKKWLSGLDSNAVTVGGVLAGTLACVPFAGELVRDLQDAPTAATASIIYLGVLPTAIAFTFWGFAIRHLPAGPLSSFSLIVPAIVVVMAWLILGETPPPLAATGGVLCLTGAGLAIFRSRRRAPAAA